MEIAKVCTYGANKYSPGGWQTVEEGIARYKDAKWRHLLMKPYDLLDEESGLLSAAHEAWNVLAELELKLRNERER